MPKGERISRREVALPPGRQLRKGEVTDAQLLAINLMRSPSEKLQPRTTCGARKKGQPSTEGEGCSHPAGWGTAHAGFGYCKYHGGNTQAGNKSAAREWGRLLISNTKFGGDLKDIPDITAEEALLEEVRRSVAMVRWLEERIGSFSLDDNNVDIGQLPSLVSESSRGTPGSTDVQAWMMLYREERSHMVRAAKTAIDAGIAERMVRIAEEQGRTLASAIRAVLDALNLSPTQAALVPSVVPRILREVSQKQPLVLEAGS